MNMTKVQLKALLQEKVCTVTFDKVNGDERVMECTLDSAILPQEQDRLLSSNPRDAFSRDNDTVLSVWDLEKEGWRSFRIANVKKVIEHD